MGTLSFTYGYRRLPHTCRWCGGRLRPENPGGAGGYRDNGKFCSLRCGYQWAVAVVLPERN